MKDNNLELLRMEVEQTFARRILTAADCSQLCEEIDLKTGVRLNSNTLRRCFGLVKSIYPPSIATVNLLSRYCGFSSFDELIEYKKRPQTNELQASNSLLQYLIFLFGELQLDQPDDATAMQLIKSTILFFRNEPGIIYPFQKQIARTRSGQEYYFEQFVNIDRLAGYYGQGLRYYLAEKRNADSQLFGHSLLALRSWLVADERALVQHHDEVLQYPVHAGMHPFLQARFFATRLLYADACGGDVDAVISDAAYIFEQLRPAPDHYRMLPCFQLVMADALVLTGNYKAAVFYARNGVALLQHSGSGNVSFGLFNALVLYKAFALAQVGNTDTAAALFATIDPTQFHFLSKQYLTIIYLTLSARLNRAKVPAEQLDFLIAETGFKKLGRLTIPLASTGSQLRVA